MFVVLVNIVFASQLVFYCLCPFRIRIYIVKASSNLASKRDRPNAIQTFIAPQRAEHLAIHQCDLFVVVFLFQRLLLFEFDRIYIARSRHRCGTNTIESNESEITQRIVRANGGGRVVEEIEMNGLVMCSRGWF